MILLDTHVVVWLYADPFGYLPEPVLNRINTEEVGLSPFVQLELAYLHEVKRIQIPGKTIIADLAPKLEMRITDPSTAMVCETATTMKWARDPFDRLLSAEATATNTPLITKNRTIRKHLDVAWWRNS